MRRLLFIAALASSCSGALAQTKRDMVMEIWKRAFSGWDTIAFYCEISPKDQTGQSLCDWAFQRLRLAALPLKVPIDRVPDEVMERSFQTAKSSRPHPLELVLEIVGTGGISPIGVHVRLSAQKYYGDALEERQFGPAEPRNTARPGTLYFWQESFLVAATLRGPELDAALRQNLETHLLTFITDYAEAR